MPLWFKVFLVLSPVVALDVLFALQCSNKELFRLAFATRSDPAHPMYRQWMTREEVQKLESHPEKEMRSLRQWVRSRCRGQCRSVRVTPAAAWVYGAPESILNGQRHPLIEFAIVLGESRERKRAHVVGGSSSPCPSLPAERNRSYIFPRAILDIYGLGDTLLRHHSSVCSLQMRGMVSTVHLDSFEAFAAACGQSWTNISKILGEPEDGESDPPGEWYLDVAYLNTMVNGAVNWLVITQGWLFEGLAELMDPGTGEIPFVISISYGVSETEGNATKFSPGSSDPAWRTYVERTDLELAKLGAMGRTVIVASGDAGPYSRSVVGTNCSDSVFSPQYPASSPYVTTVGGVTVLGPAAGSSLPRPKICTCPSLPCLDPRSSLQREASMNPTNCGITSGGGFSNYASQPLFQRHAVQDYLIKFASQLPPAHFFNSSGRAYPDIAAPAGNLHLAWMQHPLLGHKPPIFHIGAGDGTSFAAPIVASLFTLVNDRISTPIGPVAPLLYSLALRNASHFFIDVVVGNTRDTCKWGFEATPGWDAATGLGEVNFPNLLKYLTTRHVK